MLSPRKIRLVPTLSLAFAIAIASGCISSNEADTTPSPSDGSDADGGSGNDMGNPATGGGGDTGDDTTTGGGEAGTGGADSGPADVTASLLYINQRVFREDDAFAYGGTARLELHDPQPLPSDDRTAFFNADNERCTFESGTEWPYVLSTGETWPAGPFQDAGNLTLTAAAAPGPVVYEHYDTYYLRLSPGPMQLGNFTHNSFFSPEYIPHGAAVALAAGGGADLGPFSVSGMHLADDYVVSSPNLIAGGDTIDTGAALSFSWSPPAPGDRMVVIVKDSFSYIKCSFDDDGQAAVPADAMALLVGGQFARFTIQTWREHSETRRVASADGQQIDVELTSRHVQIGRFDSQ